MFFGADGGPVLQLLCVLTPLGKCRAVNWVLLGRREENYNVMQRMVYVRRAMLTKCCRAPRAETCRMHKQAW